MQDVNIPIEIHFDKGRFSIIHSAREEWKRSNGKFKFEFEFEFKKEVVAVGDRDQAKTIRCAKI